MLTALTSADLARRERWVHLEKEWQRLSVTMPDALADELVGLRREFGYFYCGREAKVPARPMPVDKQTTS